MSLFKKIDPNDQKNKAFSEIEKKYGGDQELVNYKKSSWLTSRGNYFGQQGKLDQAINDFKEAIVLKPDHTPTYAALGVAFREKGMFQEALTILNKAPHKMKIFGKEVHCSEFELYNIIVTVYMLMGDKLKTIEYAKRAIKASSDPKRKKQKEFAELAGVVEKDDYDSQMIKNLQGLIQELENNNI